MKTIVQFTVGDYSAVEDDKGNVIFERNPEPVYLGIAEPTGAVRLSLVDRPVERVRTAIANQYDEGLRV